MTTDLTAAISACLGVIGTLAATIATQRSALRSKKLEAESHRQVLADDRAFTSRQAASEEKRASYAELNSTVRVFRSAAYDQLLTLMEDPAGAYPLAPIEAVRQAYKDRYSRAQMMLPDRPMLVAVELNRGISSAYRVLFKLTLSYDAKAAGVLQRWFSDGLSDGVWLLREVLRQDLGVVPDIPNFDEVLARLRHERKTTVETLPGARASRQRGPDGTTDQAMSMPGPEGSRRMTPSGNQWS